MDPKPKTTPKDFFLYVGAMIALYISAVSLLNLLFDVIEKVFPDRLDYYYDFTSSSLRWTVASLVIIFPIYLVLTKFINKSISTNPDKKEIGVRKWLTFLTLFIAGLTLAIDLVTLIYYFLGGEVTARFAVKVLAVFVVSGGVFSYYWVDLKRAIESNASKYWTWISSAVILLSIIGAFVYIGSPFTQRLMRFDEQRVADLQNIQSQIINYWQNKGILPAQASDLNDSIGGFTLPTDPKTDIQYEYSKITSTSFKLCAKFDLESQQNNSTVYDTNNNWKHTSGNVCFDRKIDQGLYPIAKTPGIKN